MNFFTSFLEFLQKPFPKDVTWFGLSKNFIAISAVMTLFLFAFQPSGISEVGPNKFLVCLGFGISGALAYFIYEIAFDQLFKFQKAPIQWTFGKWLLYSLGVLFFISLANFLYIRYLFFGYMQWNLFPYMIKGVFMFGIPVLAAITLILLREEKKYQTIAQEINQQKDDASTQINAKDLSIFGIPTNQIKYIEALQNYVTIGFINKEGQFQKQTERATLKNILATTKESSILRTHRSFLVNQQAIIETTGNSQGLLLTLSDCDKTIPVSRSYVAAFRKI